MCKFPAWLVKPIGGGGKWGRGKPLPYSTFQQAFSTSSYVLFHVTHVLHVSQKANRMWLK